MSADGELQRVARQADGRIVTFGCCLGAGEFLLRSYEPDATIAWTTTLRVFHEALFGYAGLAVDRHGNIVVASITPARELWLGKYDGAGREIWAKIPTEPELAGVEPTALVATPQGKYVLGGRVQVGSDMDLFYGVFDETGKLLYRDVISTDNAYQVRDLAVDSRGVILVAGESVDASLLTRGYVRMFAP
jgi:hypothetical protein